MREKLKSLPLAELKAIARHQGLKGVSVMRKADLIDLLCAKAEELETQAAAETQADGAAGERTGAAVRGQAASEADRRDGYAADGENAGAADPGTGMELLGYRQCADGSPEPDLSAAAEQ